jgi:hypothetical protein
MGTPKKRRNSSCISSSGPPAPGELGRAFSRVRMFTTEGPTCSTKSVKSGKPRTAATGACANAAVVGSMAHAAIRAVAMQADAAVFMNLLFSTKCLLVSVKTRLQLSGRCG